MVLIILESAYIINQCVNATITVHVAAIIQVYIHVCFS